MTCAPAFPGSCTKHKALRYKECIMSENESIKDKLLCIYDKFAPDLDELYTQLVEEGTE